jgi:Nucleoside diphosphate kinase
MHIGESRKVMASLLPLRRVHGIAGAHSQPACFRHLRSIAIDHRLQGERCPMERTFAIIKPNAFNAGNTGKIIARIYAEGFRIVGMKKLFLSKREAEGFYAVHKNRPFFGELTDFMSCGPCVAMVLEAEDAIRRWRDLMGATNPANAAEGTLRREFGESLEANATHGSDGPETAAFEIGYFFSGMELLA